MRNIKFRVWTKKTVDHYISDPINIAYKEFEDIEPHIQDEEWDTWYKQREDRIKEIAETMDCKSSDRYKITYEMAPCGITDKGFPMKLHNCEAIEVMQFTGAKDKSGIEIYEGDILRGFEYPFSCDGEFNYIAEVVWFENCHSFGVITHKSSDTKVSGISDGDTCLMEDWNPNNWEVIGNIYQNSELLK